ncbi:hypothetical protein UFOVP232_30 [uncultured Caudovirales phage]|uniref:Uncharacterized protein n=1 Tax=uncultured Caudovirales phage TaxID=2100421 RepID=A0A6J7WTK6_9CAUD|nr:hypothetical protein UFOVP232_30 [uncultured Caudovirales phage]
MKTIAVRVSDADHKLFHQLADHEYMPISVLIRRMLMQLADERGLREPNTAPAATMPTPAPTPKPIVRATMPLMDIDFDDGLNVEPPDWDA